jgi:mannose-6-phosphate isomerase class I
VDLNELMRILYFHPFMPELLEPPGIEGLEGIKGLESAEDGKGVQPPGGKGVFTYPSPCKEFSLSVIGSMEGPFPFRGPAIIVITRGRLRVSAGEDTSWELKQGESAFIPPGARLTLGGDYTLYAASVPAPAPGAGQPY